MGFFDLFKKQSVNDIYDEIRHKIILSTLKFGEQLQAANNQLATHAAAELIYLLIHLLDRTSAQTLGMAKRDVIIDEISKRVIAAYVGTVLKPETPQHVTQALALQMFNDLNERQIIYSQCASVGGGFPTKGTMIFVLLFFVHRALGLTKREDINELLFGSNKIEQADLADLPDIETTLKLSIFIGNCITAMKLKETLQNLK